MSDRDYCNCVPTCHCKPKNNGWISVKDREPEMGVNVLVWKKGSDVLLSKRIMWNRKPSWEFIYPRYWMPLPPPPDEKGFCA